MEFSKGNSNTTRNIPNPCRDTIDFNSTVPCGTINITRVKDKILSEHNNLSHIRWPRDNKICCHFPMGLYHKIDRRNYSVHTFAIIDGDYLNSDYSLYSQQEEGDFIVFPKGSFFKDKAGNNHDYANFRVPKHIKSITSYPEDNSLVRLRKMYVIPNPLVEQEILNHITLVSKNADLSTIFPLQVVHERAKIDREGNETVFYYYRHNDLID